MKGRPRGRTCVLRAAWRMVGITSIKLGLWEPLGRVGHTEAQQKEAEAFTNMLVRSVWVRGAPPVYTIRTSATRHPPIAFEEPRDVLRLDQLQSCISSFSKLILLLYQYHTPLEVSCGWSGKFPHTTLKSTFHSKFILSHNPLKKLGSQHIRFARPSIDFFRQYLGCASTKFLFNFWNFGQASRSL